MIRAHRGHERLGDVIDSDVENAEGSPGTDIMVGSPGNNVLDGGPGADQLDGGYGNDELLGGGGADTLDGGPGPGQIDTVADSDKISGGYGADTVSYATRTLPVIVDIDGGLDGQAFEGDLVAKDVENIQGGAGNDKLSGDFTINANKLTGGPHDDQLNGRFGDDALFGGDGFDNLDGGAQIDLCDAGPGGGTAVNCEP